MKGNKKPNPFAGMKRLRLPALHMITSREGGVPLYDALEAQFFGLLHDQLPHKCLIGSDRSLINEEWSYLSEDDRFVFGAMATVAVETVQRYICEGLHSPMEIPLGLLVERPKWAKAHYSIGGPGSQEARALVVRLKREIAEGTLAPALIS